MMEVRGRGRSDGYDYEGRSRLPKAGVDPTAAPPKPIVHFLVLIPVKRQQKNIFSGDFIC